MINSYLQRPLKYFLGHSIFLHFFIIALFLGVTKLLDISFESKRKSNMVLVESSVRIDMVAMPKMTIKELRNIKPLDLGGDAGSAVKEPPKKVESKNDSKIEFEKKGEKPMSFMEKMKLLAKQKAKAEKQKNKGSSSTANKKQDAKSQKELRDLILAGNKLSKGSSTVGNGAGAVTAFQGYVQQMTEQVKQNWKLPSYLLNKDLRCRIRVYLGASGNLLRTEVYESSGDPEYDSKAIEAIEGSAPFPSLSKEIRTRASKGDVLLGFPL
ncbi:MAG: TolA protein [Bacteriovoracaceae bacterium]|jgi:TolA protein